MLRRGAVVVDRDGEVVVATKIRKRCALSSSGASDPLRKLRLKKRGVAGLGRRGVGGGGGGGVLSPWSSRKMSESSWNGRRCHGGAAAAAADDGTRSAASARKLVGALRQLSSPDDEDAARRSSAHRRCVSVEFSKRSRTRSKALEADGQRSWHNGHGHWFSDMLSNGSTMEVHAWRSHDCASPCRGGERMAPHLKEVCSSLAASKELVKALAGIWGPGDGALNPSTAASLLSALRAELDLARAHARRLAKEDRRRGDEAARARARLAEDAREWGRRQREKAAAAVRVAAAELDGERRSRRRAERVNAKLGRALADAERELAASRRELERERRSRERLEKLCDELVRGGLAGAGGVDGGGRGGEEEVEEMRREAERAQEELEKEREMLRLADELREERVQMKLLEARLQFEEKNAVVEQLRDELEAFLGSKKDRQQQEEPPPPDADDHHHGLPDAHIQSILVAVNKNGDHEDDDGGDEEDDGSEMHSIELNMDGNSKDYSWSYTTASKDMATTARSKNAASVHGALISDRGTELAAAAIDRRSQEDGGEEVDGDRWDDGGCSERSKDLDEEDAERYEAIKNLREQMLAGHGFVLVSQEWGQC
uniref:Uncharacterized protein n=1 Tax=Oryza meridionalis TaxID=40149 RepID=A0A0E0CKX2_9ORYZ